MVKDEQFINYEQEIDYFLQGVGLRVEQPNGTKGSLKWIQVAVNEHPDILNREIASACRLSNSESITWLSPLKNDNYAEYRDALFLKCLSLEQLQKPLINFWPKLGPQWDALGKTSKGKIILVEAKANIPEIISPESKASAASKKLIEKSLQKTQRYLGIDTKIDWSGKLYQYTNRIAHLYFLSILNKIPSYMIFVYFIGAKEVGGPQTIAEWQSALTVVKNVIGLGKRHKFSKYIADVFIDISSLNTTKKKI